MHLDECFAMIARLSPNAAKLAARMLRKDPAAPAEWAFALEVGLADRAQGSDPLTTDDLLLIAMDKDPKHFPAGPAAEYSAQQVQAMEFVRAVRRKGPYPVSAASALGAICSPLLDEVDAGARREEALTGRYRAASVDMRSAAAARRHRISCSVAGVGLRPCIVIMPTGGSSIGTGSLSALTRPSPSKCRATPSARKPAADRSRMQLSVTRKDAVSTMSTGGTRRCL